MLVAHGDRPPSSRWNVSQPAEQTDHLQRCPRATRQQPVRELGQSDRKRVGSRDSAFDQIRWASAHSSEIAQRP